MIKLYLIICKLIDRCCRYIPEIELDYNIIYNDLLLRNTPNEHTIIWDDNTTENPDYSIYTNSPMPIDYTTYTNSPAEWVCNDTPSPVSNKTRGYRISFRNTTTTANIKTDTGQ